MGVLGGVADIRIVDEGFLWDCLCVLARVVVHLHMHLKH